MRLHFVLLIALALTARTAFGQSKQRRMLPAIIDSAGSIVPVSKVPFDGKYYYIKLVPVDSSNIDNMPMFAPNLNVPPSGLKIFIRRDSLQHLHPDSIFRLSPTPGETEKGRQRQK